MRVTSAAILLLPPPPLCFCVARRLFFAAQQRIAITSSPNYYKKIQRFTTRKNQEHGPDVMQVWRNHQKTIAVEKMSQTKPHASVALPHPPSQMAIISGGFSTLWTKSRKIYALLRPATLDRDF